jgi:hypothetical protein
MRVGRAWTAYLCLDRSGFCVMKESLVEIATVSRCEWRIPKKSFLDRRSFGYNEVGRKSYSDAIEEEVTDE